MNYIKIYDSIINRAKIRYLDSSIYTEKHHIIPRCMGGSDDVTNIAILTAREHYVCHQLLIKIHPEHHGLIKAANMMCVGEKRNNRRYEWLRIKHSKSMSILQKGKNNSQYGTQWVYKINSNERFKINKGDDIPDGFTLGKMQYCSTEHCNKLIKSKSSSNYCVDCSNDVLLERNRKTSKTVSDRHMKRALELYEFYKKSSYTSIRKFANDDICEMSHTTLYKYIKKLNS